MRAFETLFKRRALGWCARAATCFVGVPKSAEVLRQGQKWHPSVTFEGLSWPLPPTELQSIVFVFGLAALLTQGVGDQLAGAVQTVSPPAGSSASNLSFRGPSAATVAKPSSAQA